MDIAELREKKAELEILAANETFCELTKRNEARANALIKDAMSEADAFRAKALLGRAQGILDANNELARRIGEIELALKQKEGEE